MIGSINVNHEVATSGTKVDIHCVSQTVCMDRNCNFILGRGVVCDFGRGNGVTIWFSGLRPMVVVDSLRIDYGCCIMTEDSREVTKF